MPHSPVFCAKLTPHRSLGKKGIHRLVILFSVLTMGSALYFFFIGAWPIVGFMGLDALALWWALTVSQQSGNAVEEISIWPDVLQIVEVNAKGEQSVKRLNPFWVNLKLARDMENRITHILLKLDDEFHEIGAFLNPDDKQSFASAFGRALALAKA